ncbi:hypothetical protein AAHB57_30310 [Bacillus cereus]
MPRNKPITFFIVAHMDDWQLFMNPNVSWELSNKENKVVFIYTTGNDAGGDKAFWMANEDAAISSVCFGISDLLYLDGEREIVNINNHVLHRWCGGNAVCYFLRLPDGNVTGSGFSSQGYQSLQKLYRRQIPFIKALDGSTIYHGWQDFVNTLQGSLIMRRAASLLSGLTIPRLIKPSTRAIIQTIEQLVWLFKLFQSTVGIIIFLISGITLGIIQ